MERNGIILAKPHYTRAAHGDRFADRWCALNVEDPDELLLARVGRNEPAAVQEMVARKLPRLLALAVRMLGDRGEAEDVAQEAFLRVWKQAPNWQRGKARFDTWLHRVVLNLCYDRLRGHHEQVMDEVPDQVDPASMPDEQIEEAEQSDQVAAALATLPARQREALVLQYYQELSNTEAAELMGVTVEALESLLSRARKNMRNALQKNMDRRKSDDT
jgi:RNA polymerase sigma-70 factor (ECF subfamily)